MAGETMSDTEAELCGCGRLARYISPANPRENSCNKFGRCMTWDQQNALLTKQRVLIQKLANMVDTIDNGYCSICGVHRVWKFAGISRYPGACQNPKCVSHEIAAVLGPSQKGTT